MYVKPSLFLLLEPANSACSLCAITVINDGLRVCCNRLRIDAVTCAGFSVIQCHAQGFVPLSPSLSDLYVGL